MHITARPIHDHPVDLVPAPRQRVWPDGGEVFFGDPTLAAATSQGWDLLCPYTVDLIWNGGNAPGDIEISAPGFVLSQVGHGVLTFQTGYQIELDPGHHLWVRGPTNHLKDGIQALDQVIESDLLPVLLTVHWRFTEPGQIVRFERGEPFATMLPYPASYIEQFEGIIEGDLVTDTDVDESSPSVTALASGAATLPDEPLPPIAFRRLPPEMPEADALALFQGDAPARISVILPACNERPYLERTFEQFLATLPAASEIVVVDNGSTDGCADFLAIPDTVPATDNPAPVPIPVERRDIAVWLLRHAQPQGVAGARNLGLDHARGEVIVFADANVDVPAGWWPPMVAVLNQPGVGMVGPAIGIYGEAHGPRAVGRRVTDARLDTEWILLGGEEPHPVDTLAGTMLMTRRAILDAVGAFDDGMRQRASEDLEISLRLKLFGYELWAVPAVDVPHLFRPKSPYAVNWVYVLYNQLRVGFLHLGPKRLVAFLEGWSTYQGFHEALALCADSDVYARRAELATRRLHDDEWLLRT